MAKGRKHGLLHHERLLGSFSHGHAHHRPAAADDLPDLGEDDVWSAMAAGDGEAAGEEAWYDNPAWRAPSGGGAARDDIRRPVGGLSLAFDGGAPPRVVHQRRNTDGSSWGGDRRHRDVAASAPVTVPAWPSAHRGDPAGSPQAPEEEFDGVEWVPPHEYLARECASGRRAAGSLFEGVGRTLKGRDLRRLRDAVWSQTGFYG